jgi:hypothetical protein
VSPRTSPANVRHQFSEAIEAIRQSDPELDLAWEMTLSIPGTSTPPDTWIIQSCGRGWESVEGRRYEGAVGTSGATDANILRGRGVPTARIGMPKLRSPDGTEVDFAMGMNAVDPASMAKLTRALVYSVVETCTRTRPAVGLAS